MTSPAAPLTTGSSDAPAYPVTGKPRLRGWLHAATFPLAVTAGLVLIVLAPTTIAKIGVAVFTATAAMLFGTSAVFHIGTWGRRAYGVLRRLDHSNIFLIIAGSYTPFALLLLPGDLARTLLLTIWGGALVGVLFRVLWVGAPRWLYTPIYVALGWTAVFFFKPMLAGGGPAVMSLVVVGGVLYTLGAVIYGTKRPNPWPRWFGFHEIFHACTVAAFVVHFVAVALSAFGPGAAAAAG